MKEKRLLLMDDENVVLDVGRKMLTAIGYRVTAVSDGHRAVAVFQQAVDEGRPFDGVILDIIVQGGMGGMETMRAIRDIDPDAVIIVSSGYSNDAALAEYERAGFNGVLAKPYRVKDMKDVLARCMG